MRSISILSFLLSLVLSLPAPTRAGERAAAETALPVLAGLEQAVEFWKLVFTRYSASELVFHNPVEPMRIYKVLTVGENNARRDLIERERKNILQEYGLQEGQQRVRAQRGIKERFAEGLRLSTRYLGQMRRIFEEEGLPVDLAYLPLVESSFQIHARSRAGALGMWQFMPSTGRLFLRVSSAVDERRDPIESTRAAARFLKQNYEVLGDWPLAVTAYNHGKEGMLRAIAEVGSRDLMEIIRRYQSPTFGYASKNFYAEFVAAVEVAKRGEEFFPELEYYPPLILGEVKLERAISIAALLKSTDVPRSEFLDWNPALDPKTRDIPSGYRVKVPGDKLELFIAAYQKVASAPLNKPEVESIGERAISWIRHRVAPGETLSQIAKNYRISVQAIQRANGLRTVHSIAAGQHLRIPKS